MSETGSDGRFRRYRLTVAFDGRGYEGWQAQRSGRGVQNVLEGVLARLFPEVGEVVSSSRTDAGVHASGMVVHVDLPWLEVRMEERHWLLSMNALLPVGVRVMALERAPEGFHARFGAKGKEYRYQIWNHRAMHPLWEGRAWHVPVALDVMAMREAAGYFPGERDFRAMTVRTGVELEDGVRRLGRCEVEGEGAEIRITLEGDGFLYKMCRRIVGTLVEVGKGKLEVSDVPVILAGGRCEDAGVTAPACGLVLWRVWYGDEGDGGG